VRTSGEREGSRSLPKVFLTTALALIVVLELNRGWRMPSYIFIELPTAAVILFLLSIAAASRRVPRSVLGTCAAAYGGGVMALSMMPKCGNVDHAGIAVIMQALVGPALFACGALLYRGHKQTSPVAAWLAGGACLLAGSEFLGLALRGHAAYFRTESAGLAGLYATIYEMTGAFAVSGLLALTAGAVIWWKGRTTTS
jgi:hypothetical protein